MWSTRCIPINGRTGTCTTVCIRTMQTIEGIDETMCTKRLLSSIYCHWTYPRCPAPLCAPRHPRHPRHPHPQPNHKSSFSSVRTIIRRQLPIVLACHSHRMYRDGVIYPPMDPIIIVQRILVPCGVSMDHERSLPMFHLHQQPQHQLLSPSPPDHFSPIIDSMANPMVGTYFIW